MATDSPIKPNPSLLAQFNTWAGSQQPSIYLPLTGISVAGLLHALNRKYIPESDRNKELLRSLLLGGLAGTGAEMMRLGTASGIHRMRQNNNIPEGAVLAQFPAPVEGYGRWKIG